MSLIDPILPVGFGFFAVAIEAFGEATLLEELFLEGGKLAIEQAFVSGR